MDGSLARVFVVANYIMDTLPTDAFRVDDGVLQFGTVKTKVRYILLLLSRTLFVSLFLSLSLSLSISIYRSHSLSLFSLSLSLSLFLPLSRPVSVLSLALFLAVSLSLPCPLSLLALLGRVFICIYDTPCTDAFAIQCVIHQLKPPPPSATAAKSVFASLRRGDTAAPSSTGTHFPALNAL